METWRVWARVAATVAVLLVVLDRAWLAFVSKRIHPARWRRWLLVVAAAGALWLALRRDTYLPFLGQATLPYTTLLVSAPTGADATVTVSVDASAVRVAYWAPSVASGSVAASPAAAYGKFDNAGVAIVVNGKATLHFRAPGAYKSPLGLTVAPHVHYRAVYRDGTMSEVRAVKV